MKGSAIGFNGAIDVSRMLGRRFALGGLVRYAGASVDLNAPGSRDVSTNGGGFQALAGVRGWTRITCVLIVFVIFLMTTKPF